MQYVKEASESDKSLPWEERKEKSILKLHNISKQGLLVVLADKTHNLSSVLMDLKNSGNSSDYWNRFNRGYEQQKWYYSELYKVFNNICTEELLLNEYNNAFIEVFMKK